MPCESRPYFVGCFPYIYHSSVSSNAVLAPIERQLLRAEGCSQIHIEDEIVPVSIGLGFRAKLLGSPVETQSDHVP